MKVVPDKIWQPQTCLVGQTVEEAKFHSPKSALSSTLNHPNKPQHRPKVLSNSLAARHAAICQKSTDPADAKDMQRTIQPNKPKPSKPTDGFLPSRERPLHKQQIYVFDRFESSIQVRVRGYKPAKQASVIVAGSRHGPLRLASRAIDCMPSCTSPVLSSWQMAL